MSKQIVLIINMVMPLFTYFWGVYLTKSRYESKIRDYIQFFDFPFKDNDIGVKLFAAMKESYILYFGLEKRMKK